MPLSLTEVMHSPIERLLCARCRTRMNLTSIAPRADRSEKRTFECPKCDFIDTKVVSDPLGSETADRLAYNIRPPA
jgi:hypothetical protein